MNLDNHVIETAISGEKALEKLNDNGFDLILSDLKMPGISGVDLLKEIRTRKIESVVIMITGYGTIESAVESMKMGAYDYFLKPFEVKDLRKKIKRVEMDLRLKKNIPIPSDLSRSILKARLEMVNFNEYRGPYLIISEDDPNNLIQKYELTNAQKICLNIHEENEIITPIIFYSLKSKIKEFIEKHDSGTIIFKGIEELLRDYKWDELKKFISYLISEIITKDFSLLIILNESAEFLTISQQELLNNSLSLFVNPVFNKIINLLSHPLRKNIILLLKNEGKLNFNKIVKKLNVERSSALAFHINKLAQESIIMKDKSLYQLSPIGYFFVDVISLLESLGFSYPQSKIKLLKINGS